MYLHTQSTPFLETEKTAPESLARGLDPEPYLRDNESFSFFAQAVKKGVTCLHLPERSTDTNVMDLYIGLTKE